MSATEDDRASGMIEATSEYPVPPISGRSNTIYPWNDMAIGDSFLAPIRLRCITGCRLNAERRTGRKFICRTVEGGTRVWRIK